MALDAEFGARLRASQPAAVQRVSIYLADTTRFNKPVTLRPWIERFVGLLTDINEGCTRLPIARGTWRTKAGTLYDKTVIIYSNIINVALFFDRLDEFVLLVHDYGRDASQDAVMVEFSGQDRGRYFSNAYFVRRSNYL